MTGGSDRSGDIASLKKQKRTGDKSTRKAAAKALDKINRQESSALVRSARGALVDAIRKGDKPRSKEINHDLAKFQGQLDSGATKAGMYAGYSDKKRGPRKCGFCGRKDRRYTLVSGKLACQSCKVEHG